MPSLPVLALLTLASGFAGFVDAAVGGGGLIQLPALLIGLPGVPITSLLGTNKFSSFSGTSFAAAHYVRARILPWRELIGPVIAAMAGSSLGAAIAYLAERRFESLIRPAILVLLVAMLAFTLFRPALGESHAPRFGLHHQRGLSILIAGLMGIYDGFFGPGMGTLLIFLFVTILGFDFLRASALAKAVNWASNAAALALFLSRGSFVPVVAVCMAVGNALGGHLGARMAIAKGNRWLRIVFIVVVIALILKLGSDVLGQAR